MTLLRRKARVRVGAYRRSPAVTIRWATPADAPRVAVLAELDDARVPPAPLLLAFVGEELWVAASPGTGAVVSDPFRPSADVAALVHERGRQLAVPELSRTRTSGLRLPMRMPETG